MSPEKYRVAVFYSISNCQPGLRGINLGNFLIKRVAEHLAREFPKLKSFCTLSPIPSLASWLAKVDTIGDPALKLSQTKKLNDSLKSLRHKHGHDLSGLSASGAPNDRDLEPLLRLAAYYLAFRSGAGDLQSGADPVARFHLHNGARLERINAQADLSRKGLKQSFGLMVNYLYDLEEIESNHERFVHGEVNASKPVHALI